MDILFLYKLEKSTIHDGLTPWPSVDEALHWHARTLRGLQATDLLQDTCPMGVDGYACTGGGCRIDCSLENNMINICFSESVGGCKTTYTSAYNDDSKRG